MSDKKTTIHYLVSLFLRKNPENFSIYHKMILRVIADYCDMPLGFCCVKQKNLALECGMSEREFRNSSNYLVKNEYLHRVFRGKLYRYRIGEIITGISNDIV